VEVERKFDEGQDISSHCVTGDHCKWCPSSPVCPAMHTTLLAVAGQTLGNLQPVTPSNPAGLDDSRLVWLAKNGDAIKDFIDQCVDHMAHVAVKDGKTWPGFKVVQSITKRRLIDKHSLTARFKANGAAAVGAFEPKLKSITKLEKIFGKDKMEQFIEKPAGAPVLVPDTDGREEYNKNALAMVPTLERKD